MHALDDPLVSTCYIPISYKKLMLICVNIVAY